jgi:hypothetical protein
MDQSDLSSYLVIVRTRYPDLFPMEVSYSIPELVEPFVEVAPPLFLWASKIIHTKCDLLHFRAFICILEVHDFMPPGDSSDDDARSPSSDDDYPSYDLGRGIL